MNATPDESASYFVAGLSYSTAKGRPRSLPECLTIDPGGIVGDRHHGSPLRAISLLRRDVARAAFKELEEADLPGRGHENILLDGPELVELRLLDTLEIGECLLEVTAIGRHVNAGGNTLCATDGTCLLSDFGIFARPQHGGDVAVGDPVLRRQRVLRAHIITVSDRASRGEYEDKSGPAAVAHLEAWCAAHHWTPWVETAIVPDEEEALNSVLSNARQHNVDLILTTGGTGAGPRDITPDVAARHVDKLIPGIMEFIRIKHGDRMPLALTSRGIAGVLGTGLLYTLPGSPRAVKEYLDEIVKSIEHLLFVVKGLGAH